MCPPPRTLLRPRRRGAEDGRAPAGLRSPGAGTGRGFFTRNSEVRASAMTAFEFQAAAHPGAGERLQASLHHAQASGAGAAAEGAPASTRGLRLGLRPGRGRRVTRPDRQAAPAPRLDEIQVSASAIPRSLAAAAGATGASSPGSEGEPGSERSLPGRDCRSPGFDVVTESVAAGDRGAGTAPGLEAPCTNEAGHARQLGMLSAGRSRTWTTRARAGWAACCPVACGRSGWRRPKMRSTAATRSSHALVLVAVLGAGLLDEVVDGGGDVGAARRDVAGMGASAWSFMMS